MGTELLPMEVIAISALLSGNDSAMEVLRGQLLTAEVERREMTGAGFFTYLTTSTTAPAVDGAPEKTTIGQVAGELRPLRNGVGCILWIESGRLKTLEGYTFDEPWPNHPGPLKITHTDALEKRLRGLRESEY